MPISQGFLARFSKMYSLPPKADIGTGPYQLRRNNGGSPRSAAPRRAKGRRPDVQTEKRCKAPASTRLECVSLPWCGRRCAERRLICTAPECSAAAHRRHRRSRLTNFRTLRYSRERGRSVSPNHRPSERHASGKARCEKPKTYFALVRLIEPARYVCLI